MTIIYIKQVSIWYKLNVCEMQQINQNQIWNHVECRVGCFVLIRLPHSVACNKTGYISDINQVVIVWLKMTYEEIKIENNYIIEIDGFSFSCEKTIACELRRSSCLWCDACSISLILVDLFTYGYQVNGDLFRTTDNHENVMRSISKTFNQHCGRWEPRTPEGMQWYAITVTASDRCC